MCRQQPCYDAAAIAAPQLDSASGAFDDGALFEADALLAPDLDSPCAWLQDSGESGLLCVDDSQGGQSNSGAGSCGQLQGAQGLAAPTVPCGAAVPSTSQSTPSSWVAAPVGSLGAGGSNSQQHSDTGLGQNAAARDAADSSGRPGASAAQQPAGSQSEEELKRQVCAAGSLLGGEEGGGIVGRCTIRSAEYLLAHTLAHAELTLAVAACAQARLQRNKENAKVSVAALEHLRACLCCIGCT